MSMFKNALAFQLPEDFRITPTPADPLPPLPVAVDPGPLELETRGFVPPMPGTYEHLSFVPFGEQRRDVICMQTATRVLPSSVVRDEIAKRHAEHEAKTGRKPGKRLRMEIRDAVLGDLLPRAFVRKTRTLAYYDDSTRRLIVDTTSRKTAEALCALLRDALGSFPARPLACENSVLHTMTGALIASWPPEEFSLGDEVEMTEPIDRTSRIKCSRHDLSADEVREHARLGKQVTRLGLIYRDRISFVLGSDLSLRKIKLLDVALEDRGDQDAEDEAARFAADFTLISGEIGAALAALDRVLRFGA